jgi:hypothetical protein
LQQLDEGTARTSNKTERLHVSKENTLGRGKAQIKRCDWNMILASRAANGTDKQLPLGLADNFLLKLSSIK